MEFDAVKLEAEDAPVAPVAAVAAVATLGEGVIDSAIVLLLLRRQTFTIPREQTLTNLFFSFSTEI